MRKGKEKPAFQIDSETLSLIDETASQMGISRSDLIRMAVNEKLFRLGVLKPKGIAPPEQANPRTTGKGGE